MPTARVFGRSPTETEREAARLVALDRLDVLDSPKDEGFGSFIRLIQQVFAVDIGIVSFIDAHRQWYKACSGFPGDELAREDTFCRYVVDVEDVVVVGDTTRDDRFSSHPAVTGSEHIRFYAGAPLRTRDGHVIGTLCAIDRRPRTFSDRDLTILEELAALVMDRVELMAAAAADSLTGAMTRRAFRTEAEQLIALALEHQHDLGCIVLDIDHFKKINDSHGHAVGDQALKAVATACRAVLGPADLLGRLSGEEFAIVLPHSDRAAAAAVAERLRTAISSLDIPADQGAVRLTASFGISSLSIGSKDFETMLAHADAAMYQAKHSGRDRCISWNSAQADQPTGSRRRVLKAGSIIFNDRRSTIDCTIKTLGSDSAGLAVSNSAGIPSEFVLAIKGEGFETSCRVIAQDRQHLEVAFR